MSFSFSFFLFDFFITLIGFRRIANLTILTHSEDGKKRIRNLCSFCFVFVTSFNEVFSVRKLSSTFHCLVFFLFWLFTKKGKFVRGVRLSTTQIYNTQSSLKGNAQFIFLCNPQKSGASRVCITFLQITQKVLTTDIFHWLELITEILSFLKIFSIRKTTIPLF